MHSTKDRRWLALAALVFLAPAVQAEMITPTSIPHPPPAVGSANGTFVYANNIVNQQYMGMGLAFQGSSTAITQLNGIAVWAPVLPDGKPPSSFSPSVQSPAGKIDYYSNWPGASLYSPVTGQALTTNAITIET